MKDIIQNIWRGIVTPSARDEDEYMFLVVALSHCLVGACFAFLGWWALLAVLAYFLTKELHDLLNGGSLIDSLADTAFILIGTTYTGAILWPFAILFAGLFGTLVFFGYKNWR